MATCDAVAIELEVVHVTNLTTCPQDTLSRSLLEPEPGPSRKRKVQFILRLYDFPCSLAQTPLLRWLSLLSQPTHDVVPHQLSRGRHISISE